MRALVGWLQTTLILLFSPVTLLIVAGTLAVSDILWLLFGRRNLPPECGSAFDAASVVIPNWNGRDLLEKYVPSFLDALRANPRNELIIVDNGSTDGSVEFVRRHFPEARVLALPENRGFGGGSNAGIRAARNDIVVLLNNDMRVGTDFLAPLLEPFADEKVFAVTSQIFFNDPSRLREETGLTQGWWERGRLRVRHRIDDEVLELFPCFYPGGGSSAFDRRKLLELGGFDALYHPFYLEDTDLGYRAWKRGWKVLYQPRSIVYHEHRGTIGRRFSKPQIDAVLEKNFFLFCWKNIHSWPRLLSHFTYMAGELAAGLLLGPNRRRPLCLGLVRAALALPAALHRRWIARSQAAIPDCEALRRPLGGYYRDRFHPIPYEPGRLQVLFVSPYPLFPPVHGGAVFMYQTLKHLSPLADIHLVALLERKEERSHHRWLRPMCASMELLQRQLTRRKGLAGWTPHAVEEFRDPELEWVLHRQICIRRIDVVQLEYAPMAQYAGSYRRIVNALFEHDIYFQSIARALRSGGAGGSSVKAFFEYLRALRFEMHSLPAMDRIQVCSNENGEYLLEFLPELRSRIQPGLRAAIDPSSIPYTEDSRVPNTMLFLGSFRHLPNRSALSWFAGSVLPRVLEREPNARLVVVGSEMPPPHQVDGPREAIEWRGYVPDARVPLVEHAVFVCPILSGSGVRVKLLEAFAAGIPVVSTRLGAEGITSEDARLCRLAEDPAAFAQCILWILRNPSETRAMTRRARAEVEQHWDVRTTAEKLEASYRQAVREKRLRSG